MPAPQSVPEALVQIAQALGEVTYPDVPGALVGIANALTSASADGNVPTLLGEVTVSSAQLLDLHNTTVELVAAPGAGKWISVTQVDGYMTFETVAYTITDSSPRVRLGSATVAVTLTNMLDSTEDRIYSSPTVQQTYAMAADAVNQPVVLDDDGQLTLGDGTLTLWVYGTVHSVPA